MKTLMIVRINDRSLDAMVRCSKIRFEPTLILDKLAPDILVLAQVYRNSRQITQLKKTIVAFGIEN